LKKQNEVSAVLSLCLLETSLERIDRGNAKDEKKQGPTGSRDAAKHYVCDP